MRIIRFMPRTARPLASSADIAADYAAACAPHRAEDARRWADENGRALIRIDVAGAPSDVFDVASEVYLETALKLSLATCRNEAA